ncbi:hypothetical protein DVR12_03765 [Chitinophaga silvatica]|uniref:DUF4440 domain-containing protein n=1 Tax=Chitinophaga silvatica TaxID=2282649 RepID=A0A3E1YHL0_9BACT|nr:hypothetical protein [Chitinophaga silvatica]RFS26913.1 hypothetical protein DVR12_03765 [Chitinophaga silvatica]
MKFLTSLSLIILLLACKQQNLNIEKENIIKCWNNWEKKSAAGDPNFYWTDDVVIMGSEIPTVKGKEAFSKMLMDLQKIPGFSITWDPAPTAIEISKEGQMAYLFSKNTVSMADSTGKIQSHKNQIIQIWKKNENGDWKAAVSIMYPDHQ